MFARSAIHLSRGLILLSEDLIPNFCPSSILMYSGIFDCAIVRRQDEDNCVLLNVRCTIVASIEKLCESRDSVVCRISDIYID